MTLVARGRGAARSAAAPSPFGWRWAVPLLLGVSLNSVNSSLIATALIPIAHSLHVTIAATAVLVASLYLVSAVAQPVLGRLADEAGARPVFLVGVVLVGVAGLLGAVATSLGELVASRVVLGIGTSACYPAAMVLVRQRSDRAGVPVPARLLGALSIAGQVSAAVGLPLGGLLVSGFGWRGTFVVNVPLAAVTLVLALTGVPRETEPARRPSARVLASRLDLPGVVLFCAAMSGWFETLRRVGSGFSPAIAGATAVVSVAFLAWERVGTAPLIDVRALLVHRRLTMTYLRSAGGFVVIYGFMYGVTQWLEEGRQLSSSQAALVLLPMSVVSAAVSLPSARSSRLSRPLAGGSALFVGAIAAMWLIGRSAPMVWVIAVVIGFGVAIGLTMIANQTALYLYAPAGEIGAAFGLLRCSNYVGAVISSALITETYGRVGAGDAGLHALAAVLLVPAGLVLVVVLADRSLRTRVVHSL